MDLTLLENTNKLKLYLCCSDLTAKGFAESIDCSAALISGYISGKKRLSKKCARLVEMGTKGFVTREDVLRDNPPLISIKSKKIVEDKEM